MKAKLLFTQAFGITSKLVNILENIIFLFVNIIKSKKKSYKSKSNNISAIVYKKY